MGNALSRRLTSQHLSPRGLRSAPSLRKAFGKRGNFGFEEGCYRREALVDSGLVVCHTAVEFYWYGEVLIW